MEQMQAKECEADKVNIVVSRDLKKMMCNRIEILRIAGDKPEPDEIEIEKMKHQVSKN